MAKLRSATDDPRSRELANDTKINLLILQPTPFCNVDCSYCYLPFRDDKTRMSDEVLKAAFERCADAELVSGGLSIIWHAGEPLVLPVEYYQNAFTIAECAFGSSVGITHCFQSNGMLIDEAWCDLFDRQDVTVGVSIDGPKRLHDRFRVTRSGAGTWDRAIAGLRMLVERGLEFHVISVLTRNALFFPDEFFEFYVSNGIEHVCFNVEEQEGIHEQTSLSDGECENLYRAFMARFLELTTASDEIKSVREFDQAFRSILGSAEGKLTNPQNEPLAIVSVAANGDFTTFSPELLGMEDTHLGDFVLGNVLENDILDVLRSEKFQNMNAQIQQGVRRCHEQCSYFPVCGGGAPANKLYENGSFDSTETMFCRYTVKALTDIVLEACKNEEGLHQVANALSVQFRTHNE